MIGSLLTLLRWPSYLLVLSFVITVMTLMASSDRNMSLPPLERHLEGLFGQQLAGTDVDIRGMSLRLDLPARQLSVRANELWVQGAGDAPDTLFEDIGAAFSLPELLHGEVNPLSLAWEGLRFGLVSDANGNLVTGFNLAPTGEQGDMPSFLTDAYASAPRSDTQRLDQAPGAGVPPERTAQSFRDFTYLPWLADTFAALPNIPAIDLSHVDLSYMDLRSGIAVETREANLRVSRQGNGRFLLELSGNLAIGTLRADPGAVDVDATSSDAWEWQVVPTTASAQVGENQRVERLVISIQGLIPGDQPTLMPDNEFWATANSAIDTNMNLRFDQSGALKSLSGDISGLMDQDIIVSVRPVVDDKTSAGGSEDTQTGWRVETLVSGLNPATQPYLLKHFDYLAALDAPFSGSTTMLYDRAGELQIYQVSAAQDAPGLLRLPDTWQHPQQVRNIALSAQGDDASMDLFTNGMEVLSKDAWVELDLNLEAQTTTRSTKIRLNVNSDQSISAGAVGALWPDANPQDEGRKWFTQNVRSGRIVTPEMSLAMSSQDDGETFDIDSATFDFGFRDAQIQVTPEAGVTSIATGRASIDNDQISVTGDQATLGPLSGRNLAISLDLSDPANGLMALEVDLEGQLVPSAWWLSRAGVGLEALPASLPLDQISGWAAGHMSARIPLSDDQQRFDQGFRYRFDGQMSQARLRAFVGGQDIVGQRVQVVSTNAQTQLFGQASIGSAATGFQTSSGFDLTFGHQSQVLSLRGQFASTIDAVAPLIGAVAEFGDGPLSGQYTYRGNTATRRARMDVVADISNVQIDLPFLFYTKPGGRSASASVSLDMVDNVPIGLSGFRASTSQAEVTGKAAFYPGQDGRVDVLFDTLRFEGSALESVALKIDNKQIDVTVDGGVIDARAAVDTLFGPGQAPRDGGAGKEKGFGLDADAEIVLRASNLDRVLLTNGRAFNNVTSSLVLRNNGVEHMRFRGQPPAIHRGRPRDVGILTASIEPIAGGYTFTLSTDDAGSAFYAANLNDSVRLGSIQIEAYSPLAFPHGAWRGSLNAEDIFLFNAPIFGQLFQVASLTGIGELMSGTGLGFSKVQADFNFAPGNIHVDNWQMLGPSIGMTGQGGIDFDQKTLNIRGTVTPLGALNEITQQLPLIGTLLNGLDGGGLFSATYTIRGPFAKPDMFVNPWTGLTPGAFRDLYKAVTGSF